ncbi:MAG: type II secretion system GspH family protein [Planctomycetes bacterium]|nr:type II secretion system GspH family protein [Planctomycetota bacterium]
MRHHSKSKNGFTLLELAIAMVLIVLVGTTAVASLQTSLKTLRGTEDTSLAVTAIRELREYTYIQTIATIDSFDGVTVTPIRGDGQPLVAAEHFTLHIQVESRNDYDPRQTVAAGTSGTRHIQVQCMDGERMVLESNWMATQK